MAQATPSISEDILTCANSSIPIGSRDWWLWLDEEATTTFRFANTAGSFTARRELKRGGRYWYAYRRQQGKLHKAYLGKSEELTLERLKTIAVSLGTRNEAEMSNSRFIENSALDKFTSLRTLAEEKEHQLHEKSHPTQSPGLTPNFPTLLHTKLSLPPSRSNVVERSRLIDKLNQGLKQKLTLITAPAGSGKTTLLSIWLTSLSEAKSNYALAWISLDDGDNDPARFWSYMLAALRPFHNAAVESAFSMLHALPASPIEAVLTVLINCLADLQRDIILILDDYHLIQMQYIHDGLTYLLEHMPQQLHLVLASRTEPPLPLARMRVQGQLTELHGADLQFTQNEAAVFFTQVMGMQLAPHEITLLEERTEGWITGLQLAALSLAQGESNANILQALSGSHRYIVDYLMEEVLNRQPVEIQSFLLHTAILDRLSGSLCDAVTGRNDSQQVLERLLNANLFLVPLDADRWWYRYHHLFAEALRTRFQQIQPEQLQSAHRKASLWFQRNGQVGEAIQHALAAQDYALAGLLIEQNVVPMLQLGAIATLKAWLDQIPHNIMLARPRLFLSYAGVYVSIGQLETAEARLRDAERAINALEQALADSYDEAQAAYLKRAQADYAVISTILAGFHGDVERAVALSRRALELIPEDDLFSPSAIAAALGTAYALNGNILAASKALSQAKVASQAGNNMHIILTSIGGQAYLLFEQGHLHEAAEIYRQCLQMATKPGGQVLPAASISYAGLGEIAYQWNDLEKAAHDLEKGIKLGSLWGEVQFHARAYCIWARVVYLQGNADHAMQITQNCEQQGLQYDVSQALLWAGATRARIWLMQGNSESAAQWAQGAGLDLNAQLNYLNEYEYLSLARVLLAKEKFDAASQLLSRLLTLTESEGRTRSVIEVLVLQALLYEAQGNSDQAMQALSRALSLAEPEGYIRVFADEGAAMVKLLLLFARRCGPEGSHRPAPTSPTSPTIPLSYIAKLLDAMGICVVLPIASKPLPLANSALIEPLSEREYFVLQRIAAGLSNQQIADELVVAISTVKWHIKHIYRKLQVHSRTQVVATARKLNLLA